MYYFLAMCTYICVHIFEYICVCEWICVQRGIQKTWNYLLDGGLPVVQASLVGEWSRNPSVSVDRLALLWETVLGFCEFVFWRLFQRVCPFHEGWFSRAPAHTTLSAQQYLTQNHMTLVPHPPYSCHLTPGDFFLFSMRKKVLKGKCFANVEEVKSKTAEAPKNHQNRWVQTLFWAVDRNLARRIALNGEPLEGDWSINM